MKVKMGSILTGVGMGVGAAYLYKNIKNGNIKSMVKKMNSAKVKALDDLENMM